MNFQPQHVWKPPGRSSRSCYQFSLPATSLLKRVVACTALMCGAQCFMVVRLGRWQSQTSNVCIEMTVQWSAMSNKAARRYYHQIQWATRDLALRTWTSFWRREGFAGMDMWNGPMVQSRQPLTTGCWKAWAWEPQDDMKAADIEGLQRMEALGYRPSW